MNEEGITEFRESLPSETFSTLMVMDVEWFVCGICLFVLFRLHLVKNLRIPPLTSAYNVTLNT